MIIITQRPNSISNHHHPILSVGVRTHKYTCQKHIQGFIRRRAHTSHTYAYSKSHGRRDRLVMASHYFCRFTQSSQTAFRLSFFPCLCPFVYLSTFILAFFFFFFLRLSFQCFFCPPNRLLCPLSSSIVLK